jgi:hypothetical protein
MVADHVERVQHAFAELAALFQDGVDDVLGRVREAGDVIVLLDVEQLVQDELLIAIWGLVIGHLNRLRRERGGYRYGAMSAGARRVLSRPLRESVMWDHRADARTIGSNVRTPAPQTRRRAA